MYFMIFQCGQVFQYASTVSRLLYNNLCIHHVVYVPIVRVFDLHVHVLRSYFGEEHSDCLMLHYSSIYTSKI